VSGPAPHWSPQWSIIIPAYNEAIRLPGYLKDVLAYLEGRDEPFEVIVVDDGSRDGTAERVREVAAARSTVVVHALGENRGKGHAVRVGTGVRGLGVHDVGEHVRHAL
jgi:dolichyl-phosphate beta-glucosyltransferase